MRLKYVTRLEPNEFTTIYRGYSHLNIVILTVNQIKHFGLIKEAFEKFRGIQGSFQRCTVISRDIHVLAALVTGRWGEKPFTLPTESSELKILNRFFEIGCGM